MKKQPIGLSIIIPVYNARQWITPTIEHIRASLLNSAFDAEIIVVDDGSTDGSAEEAEAVKLPNNIPCTVMRQKNSGRYLARKAGVLKAKKDNILFIDSRVFIGEQSLAYLYDKLKDNPDQIWNGHVEIEKKQGGIFARFWDAVACIGWRKYFRKPHETSYGIEEFDHYPKGTGFFFVPKNRLKEAMSFFEKTTNDIENSSDDTLLIRYLAERQNIHLSPDFSCLYHGRSNLPSFLKHAYYRGQFFIDGFLRPGTRFFLPLVGVLSVSFLGLMALIAYPFIMLKVVLIGAVIFSVGLLLGSMYFGVKWRDAASLALLGVPFAVVYLAGLWRGVFRKNYLLNIIANVMEKKRGVLNGSLFEYFLVSLFFLFVIICATGSVFFNIDSQIFTSGSGDATAGFLWINAVNDTLNPFVSSYDVTNFPFGETASGVLLISYLAYWLPMRMLSFMTDPVVALNIIMYAGYVLSALAGYLVVKRLTSSWYAALLAGFSVMMVPYVIIKSVAHMSYIFGGIYALIIGAFIAFWRGPTLKKALLFGFLVGLSFYFDGYFILMTIVLSVVLILSGLLYSLTQERSAREWMKLLKMSLLAVVTAATIVSPMGVALLTQGDAITQDLASNRSGIEQEIRNYRSNVIDFIAPPQDSLIWKDNSEVLKMNTLKNERSNASENTNYISFILYLISAIGAALVFIRMISSRRSSLGWMSNIEWQNVRLLFFIVSFGVIISLAVMFSPEIVVGGVNIPLPGAFLIEKDIALWRVLSRLFVLYNVFIVIWAAISVWMIYKSIDNSSLKRAARLKIIAPTIVVLVFCGVALDYTQVFSHRPFDFEQVPKTYKWLAQREDINSIAHMPFVDPLDSLTGDYMTWQIVHGKKVTNLKVPGPSRLNNALGPDLDSETVNFIKKRGVDAVLLLDPAGRCNYSKLGSTVYREKVEVYDKESQQNMQKYLCTVKVASADRGAIDPVFAVFKEGFSPSSGAPDQSVIVLKEGSRGAVEFTESDLKTPYQGKVTLNADLYVDTDVSTPIRLIIKQNDSIVGEKILVANTENEVNIELYGKLKTQLIIETQERTLNLGEARLENVIVSAHH